MNLPFFDMLKHVITNVKNKNEKDPNVKTADASVFDKLQEKMSQPAQNTGGDIFDKLKNDMDNVKRENAADPNVETADDSVFANMQRELEALKAKLAEKEKENREDTANWNTPVATSAPVTTSRSVEAPAKKEAEAMMAMTNSGGGSLSIRTQPDMGAPTLDVRIADSSLVQVIEYSDNSIHLDGKQTRFVKVAVKGHQGWILESYLNFN